MIEQAQILKQKVIDKYPQLQEEIDDLYQLMLDEIDEGNSVTHECELFMSEVDTLYKEQQELE